MASVGRLAGGLVGGRRRRSARCGRRAAAVPRPEDAELDEAKALVGKFGPKVGGADATLPAYDPALLSSLEQLTGIDKEMLPYLLRLPSSSTGGMGALQDSAEGYKAWKAALERGLLPGEELGWPGDDEFRGALLDAFRDLDMARFTRRFPPLLDTLMKNVLELLNAYELEKGPDDGEGEDGGEERQPIRDQKQQQRSQAGDGDGGDGDEQSDEQGEQSGEQAEASDGQGGEGSPTDAEAQQQQMENTEFDMNDQDQQPGKDQPGKATRESNRDIAERLMQEFKDQWEPAMDKLEQAANMFEGLDLADLAEGPEGYDLSRGLWQETGWEVMEDLRKKLEGLKELRDLVRKLGRGGGRGPLRRGPRQRAQRGASPGVVRSPTEPLETRGLTRSDDLSRMLPSEAALLATGQRAARLLHFARRAERTLLSYERVGWADEPAVMLEGTEVRPCEESGPIILCLDTSGSMMGARETVAKALALECLRQARAQNRGCYLYSFSGPQDCEELELKVTADSMRKLLQFLARSFRGGTDVDEPFIRALQRLRTDYWNNADILLVTDGEIRPPDENLVKELDVAKEELGLRVHSMLVGDHGRMEVLEALCTEGDIHRFTAWSKV